MFSNRVEGAASGLRRTAGKMEFRENSAVMVLSVTVLTSQSIVLSENTYCRPREPNSTIKAVTMPSFWVTVPPRL